uniref:Uncharacterized protein n=1 Tax=Leersia perrieri TaxID=77586 RepID=A0A0D9VCD4_9ORYZ
MRASSIVPCKRLTGKERYSRGMLPKNWLYPRSRTAKDGELMQNEEGIWPVKLLLLALIVTRFLIFSHVMDVIPSHTQQSVPFPHDLEMPPSCESPARNRRRELFSCSRHAMVDVAMASSSSKASLLLHGEWGAFFMTNLDEFCENDLSFFLEGRNGKFVAPGANTQIKYYQSLDHHKLALNKLNFLLELNLEGPMPKGGQTSTFSSSSFHGNPKLCGSMFGAGDHTTPTNISEKECNSKVIISAIASCVFFGIGMLYDQLVLSTYFR